MAAEHQQWFSEAKFGLFIHFGLYSLLAGEYKGQKTENIAEWIENDLNIPVEEYRKLAEKFDPKQFDPASIVSQAKKWGMKYIVITSKHHEGFAMYASAVSDYTITKTPYGRDLIGELKAECDRQGMRLGLYYSQAQDWDDPNGYMAGKDNSHKNFRKYLDEKCLPQLREILTQYPGLGLIWFDTPMSQSKEESQEMIDLVNELQPQCIVSGRIGNGLGEYMTTGDNFIPALSYPGDWEVPATLNDTWGFSKFDHNWKDPKKLIRILLKINARGGNYLLNVGPKGDGSLPEEAVSILNEVGNYVKTNEDSIFGTFRLPQYPYEIQEVLFTAKPHKLFIHVIEPIGRYRLDVNNFKNHIRKVTVLGTGDELEFYSNAADTQGMGFFSAILGEKYRYESYYCICVEYEEEYPVFQEIEK